MPREQSWDDWLKAKRVDELEAAEAKAGTATPPALLRVISLLPQFGQPGRLLIVDVLRVLGGAYQAGLSSDDLHAAMVDDPRLVPSAALLVVRFRPCFEPLPRLVAVDARRLPAQERWAAA